MCEWSQENLHIPHCVAVFFFRFSVMFSPYLCCCLGNRNVFKWRWFASRTSFWLGGSTTKTLGRRKILLILEQVANSLEFAVHSRTPVKNLSWLQIWSLWLFMTFWSLHVLHKCIEVWYWVMCYDTVRCENETVWETFKIWHHVV